MHNASFICISMFHLQLTPNQFCKAEVQPIEPKNKKDTTAPAQKGMEIPYHEAFLSIFKENKMVK